MIFNVTPADLSMSRHLGSLRCPPNWILCFTGVFGWLHQADHVTIAVRLDLTINAGSAVSKRIQLSLFALIMTN